jgi:hypothetical protein
MFAGMGLDAAELAAVDAPIGFTVLVVMAFLGEDVGVQAGVSGS